MSIRTIELRVAPSGVAWKGVSSEEVTYVQAVDLKWAQWIRVARGFQLRLGLRDHKKHKFDGFIREVTTHVPNPCWMLMYDLGS